MPRTSRTKALLAARETTGRLSCCTSTQFNYKMRRDGRGRLRALWPHAGRVCFQAAPTRPSALRGTACGSNARRDRSRRSADARAGGVPAARAQIYVGPDTALPTWQPRWAFRRSRFTAHRPRKWGPGHSNFRDREIRGGASAAGARQRAPDQGLQACTPCLKKAAAAMWQASATACSCCWPAA